MKIFPEAKTRILDFKLPEPLSERWGCPCGSTLFTLWTDEMIYCGACRTEILMLKAKPSEVKP